MLDHEKQQSKLFLCQVEETDRQGFQLEIHVIGDRAAEFAVNALENCGITPEKRPILVHCQVLTHGLVKR